MRELVVIVFCIGLLGRQARSHRGPATATLHVTVLDETRGVLPGATVTLAGIEAGNKARHDCAGAASPQGQASSRTSRPAATRSRRSSRASRRGRLPEVRIRSGENRQVVMLPLDRVLSSVHGLAR